MTYLVNFGSDEVRPVRIAGAFGATSDACFIRPSMQSVTTKLRKFDPSQTPSD